MYRRVLDYIKPGKRSFSKDLFPTLMRDNSGCMDILQKTGATSVTRLLISGNDVMNGIVRVNAGYRK